MSTDMTDDNNMDIHQILDYLPHRYPFLLVDKVTDLKKGESIECIKNVTYNEPYFLGHFRYHPVMPGVLMIEAMAQACGLLAFKTLDVKPDNKHVFYLVGVDDVRFRQPVFPGDQLIITAKLLKSKKTMWKFETSVKTTEKEICSATVMCTEKNL